ncbi:MAG: class I SAM-dependent methyltransferase [Pseudomonadota bacterium]|nr:class I SAM-dependent methyltransferase [Pseudomonadota bacterium]
MRYKECCGSLQEGHATRHRAAAAVLTDADPVERKDRAMKFSEDWFSQNIPTWTALLAEFRGRSRVRALEIGVFEGRSTCWLLENILTGEGSTIDCIDTFAGGIEHVYRGIDMAAVRTRFEANVAPWREQVTLHVGKSAELLPKFSGPYDFIYVDGSHVAADVLVDIVLAWRLASDHGIMIFDDYAWPRYLDQPWLRPQMAIDAFLQCFAGWYEGLQVGRQVAIRKLPAYQPPAPLAASPPTPP